MRFFRIENVKTIRRDREHRRHAVTLTKTFSSCQHFAIENERKWRFQPPGMEVPASIVGHGIDTRKDGSDDARGQALWAIRTSL